MAKSAFVKFEVSKDLADKSYESVEMAKSSGKLRKGINETTKCIERGLAKLVIMAEDVTPEEIMMHIPVLCKEKSVPFTYVPSKAELGKAAGIEIPTASIAIEETGESKKIVSEISSKVDSLSKGKAEKPAAPKEEKKEEPAETKEAPKKEPKEEKKAPKAEPKKAPKEDKKKGKKE
ncbi:MAG: 50S ribosomal protein L7ae [Candidatus Aenigmarchaeota archaeon]|nr:50S ribosomal protein L7ae [Candidatus Aenigmarchaeota archaeon]